jgi:hypothetical protein
MLALQLELFLSIALGSGSSAPENGLRALLNIWIVRHLSKIFMPSTHMLAMTANAYGIEVIALESSTRDLKHEIYSVGW